MATRMQQRRATAAQWTSVNPVLAAGEIGFETDTNKFKIGNSVNTWDTLDYFAAGAEVDLTGYATETYVDSENASQTATITAAYEAYADGATTDMATTTYVDDQDVATLAAANAYTDTEIAALVDSSPATLDTLNELAAALGDDANFATTVSNQIAAKADASHTHAISDVTNLQSELDAIPSTLNDLSDVSTAGATSGEVLSFNGTSWAAATASSGAPQAGTMILNEAGYWSALNLSPGNGTMYRISFNNSIDSTKKVLIEVDFSIKGTTWADWNIDNTWSIQTEDGAYEDILAYNSHIWSANDGDFQHSAGGSGHLYFPANTYVYADDMYLKMVGERMRNTDIKVSYRVYEIA